MASGAQASEIQKLYTGYRTLHQYEDINIIKNNYNKGIAIVSLRDKYDTICTLMKDIYDGVPNDNKTLIGKNLMNACENIAKNRVNKETSYTKMMMIEKSNQLFDEGTKAYLRKYFVQEKLMALWNLIVKVKDMFQTIIQQAPASKTCSK